MTSGDCAELELLLQADHDGELDIAGSARLAAHLTRCPDCTRRQAEIALLSQHLRSTKLYRPASATLRHSVEAAMHQARAQAAQKPGLLTKESPWWAWSQQRKIWPRTLLPMGAGAFAAVLLLVLIMPSQPDLSDSVVASHIRALQPGHLMDVTSSDQHTVKPWFDGRLDYAPPVKDLVAQGFPLAGGRLDYLGGRPVAALAYRRAQHVIDLYVWPSGGQEPDIGRSGARSGYNYERWRKDGMEFWAVSDLGANELAQFARRWRDAP